LAIGDGGKRCPMISVRICSYPYITTIKKFIAAVPRKGALSLTGRSYLGSLKISRKKMKKRKAHDWLRGTAGKDKKACAGICRSTYTMAFFLVFIAAVLEKEGVSFKVTNLSLITEKIKNKKGGFMRCGLNQVKCPICGEPLVMRNGYYFCRICLKNFEKSTHIKVSDLKKWRAKYQAARP
jgi:ribosomal protein S14